MLKHRGCCYDNFIRKHGYYLDQVDSEAVEGSTMRPRVRPAVRANHENKKKNLLG